jgi:hypothetical protein
MHFVTVLHSKERRHRCWGYFSDEETAVKSVLQNWTDMYEHGYYDLAVIETIPEGLCAVPDKTTWFSAEMVGDSEYSVTRLSEPPERFQRVGMFALG